MNERQKNMFDLIQQKGKISTGKLASLFYVSPMTVRRDLADMEKEGLIRRYRGGALSRMKEQELPIAQRYYQDEQEKRILGKKAASLLQDHLNLFLDSSSTCSYIIPYMKEFRDLQLITNSVISLQIAARYQLPAILIGGVYDPQDMCLAGPDAVAQAERYNVDLAFFSTRACSDDGIISDASLQQLEVRKAIMRHARRRVFLFESAKLHQKSLYTLCHVDDIDDLLLTSGEQLHPDS